MRPEKFDVADHWRRLRRSGHRLPSERDLSGLDPDHRAGAGAGCTRLRPQRESDPAIGRRPRHPRGRRRQHPGVRQAPLRAGLSPDRVAPAGTAGPAGGSSRDRSGGVVATRGGRSAPACPTSRGARLRGGPRDARRRRDRHLGAAPALPGGRPEPRRQGSAELRGPGDLRQGSVPGRDQPRTAGGRLPDQRGGSLGRRGWPPWPAPPASRSDLGSATCSP